MTNKDKLKRFIELHILISKYEEEKKELSKELAKDFWSESRLIDGYYVSKWEKVTWKLKEDFKDKESSLKEKYPQYTKFNLNQFAKEKPENASLIADKNVSEFLTPRKKK